MTKPEEKVGVYVKCLNNKFFELEPLEDSHTFTIVRVLKYYFGKRSKDYNFDTLYNWCEENIRCSRTRSYAKNDIRIDDWYKDNGLTSFECESAIELYLEGE